jgi:hypothetical protein
MASNNFRHVVLENPLEFSTDEEINDYAVGLLEEIKLKFNRSDQRLIYSFVDHQQIEVVYVSQKLIINIFKILFFIDKNGAFSCTITPSSSSVGDSESFREFILLFTQAMPCTGEINLPQTDQLLTMCQTNNYLGFGLDYFLRLLRDGKNPTNIFYLAKIIKKLKNSGVDSLIHEKIKELEHLQTGDCQIRQLAINELKYILT